MSLWFFASDLHGDEARYVTLLERICRERPEAVLLGGDLLGAAVLASFDPTRVDFVNDFLAARLLRVRERLGSDYPRVLVILGNDDRRVYEAAMLAASVQGVWEYVHGRCCAVGGYEVLGYACVPPTPFLLKDWERYDVSRYVDPGCVSPEEGVRTIPQAADEVRYGTIAGDLERMAAGRSFDRAVLLSHAPPHETVLDRAALDGRFVEHVPLNVHVGSIAVRRFIERHQPLMGLHGHVHESARLTGEWRARIGRTWCCSAAHDGPELALVRFDPGDPGGATRELI